MCHALLIGDNMIVSRAIENRLMPHGFDSFDRVWARSQATEAAALRPPALIVVGDSIADGSPLEVARRIAISCDVPIFIVTSGRVQLERYRPAGTQITGPFHIVQLDAVLASVGENAREPSALAA